MIKPEDKWLINVVCQIVSKVKNTLAPVDNQTLEKICDKFGIEVNGSSERIFQLVRETIEKNNKILETIDFDDMLFLPYHYKMSVQQYMWVLGDEVQDWNRAQIELIKKLVKPEGRVLAVGDVNQCQSAGTKILRATKRASNQVVKNKTIFYETKIEDLKIGDEIVAYSTMYGCYIYSAKINGISKRVFEGRMRKIRTADKKEHEVTPNHFCTVRWKKKPKKSYCVYLMKKGDWFRVGTSRLFDDKYGGLGPSGRMTVEKADCYWILAAFENKMDALVEEQFVSYYYGIPQTRFFGFDGYGYEQPIIDSIFEKLLNKTNLCERANNCLIEYDREIKYPFCSKNDFVEFQGKKMGKGAKLMKITASNLMPDWMVIPSVDNNCRQNNFVDFEVEVFLTKEYVYGLDVDKHHTYVSNGILTGNSMYGFRGAAPDAMQKIQEAFNATILPLSISYRNPISHIDLINRLFPEIKHEKSPFAKQGEVLSMSYDKMLGSVKDGDLVLCRNNAPLVEPVFALIRMGVKATIRGRDIGQGLISLCERFNVKSTNELLDKLEAYRIKEVCKLLKAEKNNQAQTLTDKVDTIFALSEGTDWVWQITQKINEVFSDKKEGVIFSTVHRAKGDEAERVFILNPQLMPSKYAKSSEEIQQERNCMFVALSRAKNTMVFVGGPAPTSFESQEMWEGCGLVGFGQVR